MFVRGYGSVHWRAGHIRFLLNGDQTLLDSIRGLIVVEHLLNRDSVLS